MKHTSGEPYDRPNDLWFDDGSVVLQVENTQFRVHRTMLSKHSDIFRDMFTVPQPPSIPTDEEVIEGCPVARLQDSAQDWTFVLQAMYSHGGMSVWRINPTFSMIAAYLRLGKKYEISELRLEAIGRLSKMYPSTLKAWDLRPRGVQSPINFELAIGFKIANLAEEMGLLSILPSCLYEICAFGLQGILDGWPDHTNSLATHTSLSSGNRERALAGFASLQVLYHSTTYECLETGQVECDTEGGCDDQRRKIFQRLFEDGPQIRNLEAWKDWADEVDMSQICRDCTRNSKELRSSGRRQIWDLLPTIFNLPPWAELLAE